MTNQKNAAAETAETPSDRIDVSLVVPVFEEQDTLPGFLERVIPILEQIGAYEIVFCVDPGRDRTVEVIERAAADNPRIGVMLFSRRFGQPAATHAGVLNSRGETCVVIDADLQDPPELIPDLYRKLVDGYDVVYAQRRSRKGESFLKIAVSWLGYKVINALSDVEIPRNTGDFRIMNRRMIEHLAKLNESHGFLRGLVAFVGFRQTGLPYDRDPRAAGEGKYNRFLGSLRIGLNGLVAFSTKPLSWMLYGGVFVASVSFVLALILVTLILFGDFSYPLGIPTITVTVLFFGGVQLASIGLVGEYVGRIYDEVRGRPHFIVDKAVNVAVKADGFRHCPDSRDDTMSRPLEKRRSL